MKKNYYATATVFLSLILQGCSNMSPPQPKDLKKDNQTQSSQSLQEEMGNKAVEQTQAAVDSSGQQQQTSASAIALQMDLAAASVLPHLGDMNNLDLESLSADSKAGMASAKMLEEKLNGRQVKDLSFDELTDLAVGSAELKTAIQDMIKGVPQETNQILLKDELEHRIVEKIKDKKISIVNDVSVSLGLASLVNEGIIKSYTGTLLHQLAIRLLRGEQDFSKQDLPVVVFSEGKVRSGYYKLEKDPQDSLNKNTLYVLDHEDLLSVPEVLVVTPNNQNQYLIVSSDDFLRTEILKRYIRLPSKFREDVGVTSKIENGAVSDKVYLMMNENPLAFGNK